MNVEVDGYTFSLSEKSNVIYVFKGDAVATVHVCFDEKDALRMFEEIKTKKKVVWQK